MRADPLNSIADGADAALDRTQRILKEALAAAERVVKEGVRTLHEQADAYAGPAGESVDEAQRYVVRRVKERPVTATLAGLGVGVLIGLLLASRGK
jgi:ElaB/YqjD/DUF883 family membrane-anchored ribosome-binding protein